MKNLVFILIALIFLTSCGNNREVFTSEKTDITTHVDVLERDTTFNIPEESNSLIAKLITVNGQIQLDQVIKASDSNSVVQAEVKIIDNYIHVDCHKQAQELFAKWKEQHTQKTIIREITDYVEVERDFTIFEIITLWAGRLFMLILLISIILILAKVKNPFFNKKS